MTTEGTVRVLCIEDDAITAKLYGKRLTSAGYQVDLVHDGEEGLARLSRNAYDVLIVDQLMPETTGLEVIQRLALRGTLPPTIMITSGGDEKVAVEAMKLGICDYLIKDAGLHFLAQLPSTIDGALEKHFLKEENRKATEALKKAREELEMKVQERTKELMTANLRLREEIAERRKAEAMIRRLIESSPIGIMIAKQGTYSYVNEAMVKMFGYQSGDEIQGRRLESLYAVEYMDLFRNGYLAIESEDAASHVKEVRAIRKNGESFSASIWLRSIESEGEPALLGFLVDVSQEQALKAQLILAQKMEALGTLAGGIAHDFNNILFAIMGHVELSMELVPKGTEIHEDLKAVLDAANRAKDLVGQILTISRQRSEGKKVPLKIGPIVKETTKFLRAVLPATIAMRYIITEDRGSIMGSATQVHQILMNLCTNAAHAMSETGGELIVTVEHTSIDIQDLSRYPDISPGQYLRVNVSDTGHGMTPEVLQQIFEPYFTTKGPVEGTGLGLASVREIVRNHGGVISVESEPGKGTTFEVLFPLIEEHTDEEDTDTKRVERGTERILIVDDDKTLAGMTGQILSLFGYKVTTRNRSVQALELFRSMPYQFDLVLTDLTMPEMTGKDLAQAIRRIRPDIPVVVWTGYCDLMTQEQAQDLGIAAMMIKPVLKSDLAKTIRGVLDRHREANHNSDRYRGTVRLPPRNGPP